MIVTTTDSQFGEYQIGGAKYFQYEMVAGQKLIVLDILKDIFTRTGGNLSVKGVEGIARLLDLFRLDDIHRFLGVVLLKEGEQPSQLAAVRDFVERGRVISFEMKKGVEREVFKDFFSLNREDLKKMLSDIGIDLDALSAEMSKEAKPTSSGA